MGKFVGMASKAPWIGIAVSAVMLFGCNGDKAAAPQDPSVKKSTDQGSKPAEQLKTTKIEDVKVGTGAVAENGDTLFMKYEGRLRSNGVVFDSTAKHGGAPLPVVLGTGGVIKGWDLGLVGMKVGGKRKLTIPTQEAYGANPPGADIPPNADLEFDVELVDVLKKSDAKTIFVLSEKPGTGREVKKGDTVTIAYKGSLADGTVFEDSKESQPKGLTFKVESGELQVVGLIKAVIGMKKGGERKVKLPPAIAFGPFGRPNPTGKGSVPANAVVFFDIKLLDVK